MQIVTKYQSLIDRWFKIDMSSDVEMVDILKVNIYSIVLDFGVLN